MLTKFKPPPKKKKKAIYTISPFFFFSIPSTFFGGKKGFGFSFFRSLEGGGGPFFGCKAHISPRSLSLSLKKMWWWERGGGGGWFWD